MPGRPHQFSVRARPNCQASSQRWGKPERSGGLRAECQFRGPGGRTRGSPRSRGRSEPAFATTRTPARLVHYNPVFLPLSSEPPAGTPDVARDQPSFDEAGGPRPPRPVARPRSLPPLIARLHPASTRGAAMAPAPFVAHRRAEGRYDLDPASILPVRCFARPVRHSARRDGSVRVREPRSGAGRPAPPNGPARFRRSPVQPCRPGAPASRSGVTADPAR